MSKHKPAAKPKKREKDFGAPRKITTKCGGTGNHRGYRRGFVVKGTEFACRTCGDKPMGV